MAIKKRQEEVEAQRKKMEEERLKRQQYLHSMLLHIFFPILLL